jgi:hypothetical protein
MELLGNVGHVESRFGNHAGCARWNSLVTWVMSNLILIYLEIVLVLV